MLISEEYRELNRQLHDTNPLYGADSFGWSKYALDLVRGNGYRTVLDYGCGKGKLKGTLAEADCAVAEYDPCIAGKDGDPEPAELVVCTDVLEHIEPVHLNAVLRHLRSKTMRRLFVTIFTGPAGKTLPDGRNAHILQKPGPWWREKLTEHFQVLLWEERGKVIAAELVAKSHTGRIRPAGRRALSKPMAAYLRQMSEQINAASDAFSQVRTVRMFEGLDDEPADLQGACDILEHLDDIDLALGDLARNSLKATFCAIKVTDMHSEWDWKRVIERRFRVSQWESSDGRLLMIGAPQINVQGVCAVGAVGADDRWENVKAATQRFTGRVETAPEHGRTAIIACYGPSLVETVETLKREAGNPETDVISVSGAHDFLISHGIVPRYHIECDPRPHKALNLDAAHPGVRYLIASVCHQDYFARLGESADIRLWHVSTQDHAIRLMNELGENAKTIISGGGSVGLRAIPLLYGMGYRNMSIFAMDCSFKTDGETVHQWAGKHAGKRQDLCEVNCDGEMFVSSPVLLTYATNFFETVQKAPDVNIRLYGNGLLQAMSRFYMRQGYMQQVEPGDGDETTQPAEQAA